MKRKKPGTYTLAGLVAWLRGQPPKLKYTWVNASTCPIARYLKARGERHLSNRRWVLEDRFCEIVYSRPRTYGAAFQRARARQQRKSA